ncbi:hypothetical protein [Polaribacter sp. Q13]|uniref:hypothetical protein n=1 Tax=Polaribacter sp. Q13 TaxID=2806551 RepID=UPI00193BCB7E|nr:hypothetical protein [Polaribacter sp. Q13]QVY66144.1 hypothetical protein JOP69_02280 [Polaribacter sp. Q13]
MGVSLTAQTSLADMEDNGGDLEDAIPTVSWTGDPNAPVSTKVANPNQSGINTTANVVQFVKNFWLRCRKCHAIVL